MAKLGDLVVRIGANTKDFNAKLGTLKSQIRKDTKNIAAMGRSLSMSVTAPLALIGASSFRTAADFEQSMAKVKAVSGATADEFAKLETNAKELGRTTRFTASEVSALQLNFAKLGFTAEEITKVTGATLALAQATDSDLATSAEVAGSTLRAFGLNADETSRVTDVMAKSFSTSALDMSTFADSMKYVAPVAKSAGLSVEETTAMLASLANAGIKGSQAGTSLRRIISELGATGGDVAGSIKKLAGEGLNLADAKDEVGRSAQSALLVLANSTDQTASLATEFQNANGAAQAMADIMDNTAEGAMKRMQSALEGAQIEIGSALAPIMIKLAGIVSDLAGRFSSMSDGGQMLILAISGIAGMIGPLLVVLPNLVSGIKAAKLAFASLNRTMLANPFGAVAAAIGLVVGAVIMLNNASSEGSNKVDDLKKSLGGMDLKQQAASIEGARTAQEAYVKQLEEEKKAILELAPHKRSANSQAGRDLKKLEASLETANQDLAAMMQLEEGVALKLKQTADGSNDAAVATNTLTLEMVKASAEAYKLQQELAKLGTQADELVDKDLNLNEAFFGKKEPQLDLQGFDFVDEVFGDEEELAAAGDRIRETAAATQGIMQQVAANINGFFTQTFQGVIAGTTTFKDALLEALKAIAIKLGAMLASFAVLSAFIPGFGAAAGGLKGFISSGFGFDIPGFASGGIVSGPTMAMVGEYPGARTNPEVIAPLDKLRSMIGGNTVQVTGKISGRDILLTSERNAIDRNRVRGF
jgi:hypothetical protein